MASWACLGWYLKECTAMDILCGNTISGHKASLCEFTARFFQAPIQQSLVVIHL